MKKLFDLTDDEPIQEGGCAAFFVVLILIIICVSLLATIYEMIAKV